jgi:CRP/FNR family transcriptional regulator, cyclic AMP receptor protein
MARRDSDLLARVPLFKGLSKRHLRSVASIAKEQRFDEKAKVSEEGKPGDDFYVILAGQASVVRRGRTVAKLVPGDFFGEIALLDGGPRTASIVADTPLEVMAVNRKPFHAMLQREPSIVLAMLEEVAGRLRNAERTLTH